MLVQQIFINCLLSTRIALGIWNTLMNKTGIALMKLTVYRWVIDMAHDNLIYF